MGGSGREREPRRPPGLGGSPPTWVEAAAGGVGRVTLANTHPALRPSPATPASRAASAPPRPVTRGRPDRHSLFPGAGRRPAGPTCPARRGAAVGLGVRGAARRGPRPAPSALGPRPPGRPPSARSRAPPEPGGKEGRRCPAPGVTRLQPAVSLPKHTAGRARGRAEPRRGTRRPRPSITGSGGKGGPGPAGRKGRAGGRRPAPLLGRARSFRTGRPAARRAGGRAGRTGSGTEPRGEDRRRRWGGLSPG